MSRTQRWSRWRRWALVLGIFALGIPASAAFFVRSNTSRARLQELASNTIRRELGLDATIGSVQLQLVPFSLVARDISLDDPVYGRTAEADELRIQPSFRTLLHGGLDIQAITIRGADLRLVVRNGQVRNLPRAEGAGPDGPPQLPFATLDVYDSTLTVDAEPHASGQLRGIELHLRGTDEGIAVDALSRDGWLRHAGGRETIQLVDASIAVTEDEVRVPRLRLRTPEARVALDDATAPFPFVEHGYSGEIELSYDLAHLERAPFPDEVTLPPMEGRVTVAARVSMEGDDQVARGTVDLAGVRIEEFGVGESVHLELLASQDRLQILEGSVAFLPLDGGRADLSGTIGLDPEAGFPVDVLAEPDELSFARLMHDLSVSEHSIVEWFFNGRMRLRGTLDPLELSGPLRLATHSFRVTHDPYHVEHPRRVIGISRGDFTGRWSIRPDAVRFEDLSVQLPRSRLHADVHLGFDNRLRAAVRSDLADLRDIAPLDHFPIAGVGTARCEIDGTFQAPRVTGTAELTDFVFDQFRLGHVESQAELDPDGLGVHFPMVTAVKRDSHYRVEDLYLNFHQDRFEMTGVLRLDGVHLVDMYHVFGFEEDERFAAYQGFVRGHSSVRYTNGFPDDSPTGTLDLDSNIDFDHATLNDFAFTDGHFVGRWRWLDWTRGARGAQLDVAHLSFRKGEGTLSIDGRMALGGAIDMNVIADRLSLSELEGIGDRMPGIEGVATVVGQVSGDVDVLQGNFDVGVTNVTYEGRALGDGRFYVRHTDRDHPWIAEAATWLPDEIPDEPCARARRGLALADWPADPPIQTIDGPRPRLTRPMAFVICGTGLDDHLAVDMAVGRSLTLPLRGALRLDGLDLSPMLPHLADGPQLEGALSGVIAFAAGEMRRPESMRGTVILDDVHVGQGELVVRNEVPVDLSFDGGVLTVNDARFVGPDSRMRVRGQASVEDGLALRVNGDVDLGLVARLSRSVNEASGRVRARLNVTGEFADPELFGEATVRDGSFRFASFSSPVEDLDGTIRFSQRSVLFEGFEAEVSGGDVAFSGEAELSDQAIARYHFDVEARDLAYDAQDGIDARFGARARLEWSDGDRLPTLRGEMFVDRFAYTQPTAVRGLGDVAATMVHGAMRTERTSIRRYDPDQDLIALDVRVVQRAPFRIQNNLIDARVRIRDEDQPFRIVGTDQRYGVHGMMEITRGELFFQNNEFEVRRGTISFHDDTRIAPELDIEAMTEVQRSSDLSAPSWRIRLALTGTPPDDLTLRTSSEPNLSEPDILMLLAFGMTSSELQQLQGGGDLATSAALEALSAITNVDREVQRALPIDDIRVTQGYNPRTGRSEPRLSVGTRIAERVRATGTTGLGETREFRGAVELSVDENQRIGVSYDNYNYTGTSSFGNLGVDWVYHLEFE